MGVPIEELKEKIRSLPSKDMCGMVRAIASEKLANCKPLGIPGLASVEDKMHGSDSELSESVLLDAIVLVACDKDDEVSFVSDNAMFLAKATGFKTPKKVSLDVQRQRVYGALGIESYIEEAYDMDTDALDEELENGYDELDGDIDEGAGDAEEEQTVADEAPREADKNSKKSNSEIEKAISNYYSQYCSGVISEILKRYTSLFSSGYEVNKPAGILTREGIVRLSGNSRSVYEDSVATTNMYDMFVGKLGFEEVSTRSVKGISNVIYNRYTSGSKSPLFLPNKLLEIAYGRCAPDGDNQESINTYKVHSDAANWSAYRSNELEKAVRHLVKQSVVGYVLQSMGDDGNYRDPSIVQGLSGFLKYMQDCLSMCILVIEYKISNLNGEREVSSFKVRVCDPQDALGSRDITPEILNTAFLGGVGKVPFSYDVRIEEDTYVKEYAHEFNHDVTQAMPLFAYKALEALKSQGISLSWENMILGMFEDGSILRNGTHGVDLLNKLIHIITAGSRAGKGVMTLAMLASGIASGKIIIYPDRKPDMASLFKYLAPGMCVINGGGYAEQYDMKYKQFTNLDSFLNSTNVPKMVTDAFQTTLTWDELGDIIYMRVLKLAIGIIVARGEGKFSDPSFGGTNGILLVADEFKNFQDSFSGLVARAASIVPPTTIDKDRESLEKGTISQRTFDRSYNDAGFYALSYLNSLAEDMKFLSEKTDAGFNQEEISLSDIVIIGQSLDKGMANRSEFIDAVRNSPGSARYRSAGNFGLKGFALGEQSIPYTLLNFKPMDAFFGRNMDDGRSVYLSQTSKDSKAYGRLDDKASNFAYMSSFTEEKRKKIVGGRVADNTQLANSCTYFKPFLILNTGDPDDDCVQGCLRRCNINGGITKEEMVSEYPNSDGTELNPAIGFEEYLKLAGINNYREILERSGAVADYVVQNCLGYPGNWFEFVTDLRPEWLFTIRDISEGAKGVTPRLSNPATNPILEEFYGFNPEYFGGSSDTDDGSESGAMDEYFSDDIGEDSGTDVNEFESSVDTFESPNPLNLNFGETEYPDDKEVETGELDINTRNVDSAKDTSNSPIDDMPGTDPGSMSVHDEVEDADTEESLNDFFTRYMNDTDPLNESEIHETGFGSSDKSTKGYVGGSEAMNKMAEILKHMEALKSLGVDLEVGPDGWVQRYAPASEHEYASSSSTDFSGRIDDINYSDEINSLSALMNLITSDIISKFGGLDRIISLKVIGGSIVVNNYYYRCHIKDIYATGIPLDVRSDINSGNISKLFNYSLIRSMPNLSDLEFDSVSFVYDYVSSALGYGSSISVNRFFDDIPRLNTLRISNDRFTRSDYMQKVVGNDMFYSPRVSTRLADASEKALGNLGYSSWNLTKKIASKKNYNIVVRALGVTGAASVAGVAYTGKTATKLGRKAFRGLKSFSMGVKDLFSQD